MEWRIVQNQIISLYLWLTYFLHLQLLLNQLGILLKKSRNETIFFIFGMKEESEALFILYFTDFKK